MRTLIGFGLAVTATSLGAFVVRLSRANDVSVGDLTADMRASANQGLKHEWRLQREKHWQIVSSPSETRAQTDATEGTRGACSAGMVEVKGNMKLDPSPNAFYDQRSIEELQKTTCTKWINKEYPERCAVFDRAKWLEASKDLGTRPMSFCIDRYEYPDQKGDYPWISVSFHEATALCAEEGKRLCDEAEWTFACEGEEAMPYPYGYERDASACVVDQPWRAFNEPAMRPRDGASAKAEYDRLWQGVQSGSEPRCKSPFGVYDLTGNVDEWTHSIRVNERPSILKGGYWGPVRTRCRPATRSHDENHVFYQQGFRCCSDVGAQTKPQRSEAPAAGSSSATP
ncbi:MAG TPA: SUMF1/EgtB/PvdO family nonheme iron enzyme [Byssovorax sp.]